MRLQQYINESTITTGISIARKIVESGIDKFYNLLKRKKFNVNYDKLIDILDESFSETGYVDVIFLDTTKKGGYGYYVSNASASFDGMIGIYISPRLPKYLFTFKDKSESEFISNNKFLEELEGALSHEYTHIKQFMNRLGLPTPVQTDYKKYLADPDEIGAYASTIAHQIHNKGKSVILWVYELHFGPNHKIVKKLKRKVVDILKDLGYDNPEIFIKSDRPKQWKKVFKEFKRGKR